MRGISCPASESASDSPFFEFFVVFESINVSPGSSANRKAETLRRSAGLLLTGLLLKGFIFNEKRVLGTHNRIHPRSRSDLEVVTAENAGWASLSCDFADLDRSASRFYLLNGHPLHLS
jgi:hypothetical protein